ncbi:lycopene cyclase family protein [Algivirga pacifica]|uniref:Lycopene cyclase family protein n=1 Tax=Algivirga pacifica TaxID=1162670 RepID=A0ABP9D8K6_9BACT
MKTAHYDIILTGGGCAAYSFLNELIASRQLPRFKVLVLEAEATFAMNKTWCFWSKERSPLVSHQWQHMSFCSPKRQSSRSIAPYYYHMVSSEYFFRYSYQKAKAFPSNIFFLQDKVVDIHRTVDGVSVTTSNHHFTASWVLNSIPTMIDSSQYRYWLWQHFRGWVIETKQECFSPEAFTMMDFRTPQQKGVEFFYVLPFSRHKALVEFTGFSPHTFEEDYYTQRLKQYIKNTLGVEHYKITYSEGGKIPMTDYCFPRSTQEHIIHTGVAGGLAKASTGYAFANIQQDVRQLVNSLVQTGQLTPHTASRQRFQFYDLLLLHIIQHKPEKVASIMDCLFARNHYPSILKFLEEETSLIEDLRLLGSLPWAPFLQALKEISIQEIYEKQRNMVNSRP